MKKIVSLILTAILLFSTIVVAFADVTTEQCPNIYIHGFMAKDILADKNDRNSEVIWPPKSDDIVAVVKECLPDILSFLVTRNYDRLGEALMEPVKGLLSSANLDSDGNASDGSGVYFVYPSASSITKTSELDFNYDWRLDPQVTASQLNDFINYVLESSGASRVTIECHSFGGVVTEAYSKIYGFSKIKSVCYNATAIFGETYTGELLTGNILLIDDSLTQFLKLTLSSSEYSKVINGVFDLLLNAGVTEDICQLGNDIVKNIGEDVVREIIAPMFAGWLSVWAMTPDDKIDAAVDYVFNDLYGGDIASHQGLYDKIISYNENVRADKKETLIAQNEVNNVYVITRYNRTSAPIVPTWQVMSDGVVDSAASSFGATFADYGSTLPDEIISEHKDDGLVNPDNTAYAGTCLFPEQTWFIREYPHANNDNDADIMVKKLLNYDGQATVDTFEEYPRFLKWDYTDKSITPDTDGTPVEELSLWQKIFNIYLKIVKFNRKIFAFFFR